MDAGQIDKPQDDTKINTGYPQRGKFFLANGCRLVYTTKKQINI